MIFQNTGSIPSLDQISRQLVQGLPRALADPYAADTPWTKAVTAQLDSMGTAQGLTVCCHGSPHREWLLDVVWMVRERHEIVLAVESE